MELRDRKRFRNFAIQRMPTESRILQIDTELSARAGNSVWSRANKSFGSQVFVNSETDFVSINIDNCKYLITNLKAVAN